MMPLQIEHSIEPLVYTSSSAHDLLSVDASRPEGPNIGLHGEHLTITFLAHNRSQLSRRLLDSIAKHIPDFKGLVLAIDNGSNEDEAAELKSMLERLPLATKYISLGANFGVAGGRNRTVPHVPTDWVMWLDNDIYFIANSLPKIQRDLAQLGCKFANLPLLNPDMRTIYSFGGHLYVGSDGNGMHVGHGGAYVPAETDLVDLSPQLGTFLFGGASVMQKQAFSAAGLYDEAMFIGYEDTDLSIRLFQAGMKVGTIGTLTLVHDHPPPAEENAEYSRVRFSREAIRSSAEYMERKHHFSFWTPGLRRWLDDVTGTVASGVEEAACVSSRPKIAIVVEVEYWAFANIARRVAERLEGEYDITILPYSLVGEDPLRLLLSLEGFDLVHFMWRPILKNLFEGALQEQCRAFGISHESLLERVLSRSAVTTAVYDHWFLDDVGLSEYRSVFRRTDGYSVSSEKLARIYRSLPGYPEPVAVLQDGVDLEHFRPQNLGRLADSAERPLVIGWAGNSRWGSEVRDFKGLHTIILPALAELEKEGVPVVQRFADRQVRLTPYSEMPNFYASVDVYICASEIEGTPNPVLEAMACGVPIVSTDVGIVREAFGPLQSKFILQERSVECLKKALMKLHHDRSLLAQLSTENLEKVARWNWRTRAAAFGEFFNAVLTKRNQNTFRKA